MEQDSTLYYYPYCTEDIPRWIDNQNINSLAHRFDVPQGTVIYRKGNKHPFSMDKVDGVTVLLLFCFLVFASMYKMLLGYFQEHIQSIFSATFVKGKTINSKQSVASESLSPYILLFLAVIVGAIVTYIAMLFSDTEVKGDATHITTIALFILSISIYFMFKIMLYRFIGYIFDASYISQSWISTYVFYYGILGVLCFLPALLFVYSSIPYSYLINFIGILFVLMHFLLFYKLIAFFITQKFNFLYLIAYLCAVEILPSVLLKEELNYIYRLDALNLLWLIK